MTALVKRWLPPAVGIGGIFASALLYFSVAARASLYPLNQSPNDVKWALFYAGLLLVGGTLYGVRLYRWLVRLVWLAGAGLLIMVLFAAPSARAVLGFLWMAAVALAVGDWILCRLLPEEKPGSTLRRVDRLLFSAGLGFGFLAIGVMIAGSLHSFDNFLPVIKRIPPLLRIYPALAGMLALTLVFLPRWLREWALPLRNWWTQQSKGDQRGAAKWLGLGAVLWIGGLFWALAPSIRYDALMYHLSIPDIYLRNGMIVPVPETFNSYWAHYAEMLYTLALLLGGQPAPGLVHLLFGVGSVGVTYAIARRVAGGEAAWLAAFLFASLPIVNFEAGTIYIDLIVTFYAACTYLALAAWWQGGSGSWLVLGGCMAGLAMGVKINAAVILLPAGLGLMAALLFRLRDRRDSGKARAWSYLVQVFSFGAPAVLLLAPWLVRDYLWTGNPVFPMLNSLFPSPLWGWDYQFYGVKLPDTSRVLRFLKLPVSMVAETKVVHYREGPDGSLGIIPILFLPWWYLTSEDVKPVVKRWAAVLLAFLVAAFLVMANISMLVRYMLPLMVLVAMLAALNLVALYRWLERNIPRLPPRWLALGGLAVLLVYAWSTRLLLTVRGWELPDRYPVEAALGIENPDQFLRRAVSVYPAFQFLNEKIGAAGNPTPPRVVSVGNEYLMYTRARIFSPFTSAETKDMLEADLDPEALYKRMREKGFDYLLVNWEMVRAFDLWTYNVFNYGFIEHYARPLHVLDDRVTLYQLLTEEEVRAGVDPLALQGMNLLANAGFEEVEASGEPVDWIAHTEAPVEDAEGKAYLGMRAVQSTGDRNSWSQIVPVTPDQLYATGMWVRSEENGKLARLQILWWDENHTLLEVSARLIFTDQQWDWVEMPASAPAGARFAEVYATAHNNDVVWIDEMCFAEGPTCQP